MRDQATARLNRDIWIGWSFYNETIGPVAREAGWAPRWASGSWKANSPPFSA